MSHIYCTECGFQNPEAANYCSRCGALLEKGDPSVEATQTFAPEEVADAQHELVEGLEGPALVVRFGGGRAGESFVPSGRAHAHRPLAGVRDLPRRRHRVAQPRGARRHDGKFSVEDEGSLNGTFVNRRRIDRSELANGDELQIGKYRLTFIER